MIGKLNDGVGVMSGQAVMSEQAVQEGTEHAPLRGPSVEEQLSGCSVTYHDHRGWPIVKVQDLVAEVGVSSHGP